ncbi:MAG: DNA repair protein RecO [bacterium]|nr:DNA repair protein RecO [bacterium]
MTYNDVGVILKRRETGEDSRIYHIYTREHGKIEAAAQGVHKIKSKLAGHLEPLTFGEFMFANGHHIERLIQARVRNSFKNFKEDLTRLGQAGFVADLADLLTKQNVKDEKVFDLVGKTLEILDKEQSVNNLEQIFAIKLMQLLGFELRLDSCVLCRRQTESSLSTLIDSVKGGMICGTCGAEASPGSILASSLTLGIIKDVFSMSLDDLHCFEMPELVGREFKDFVSAYTEAHLEFKPKSRYFLEFATNN